MTQPRPVVLTISAHDPSGGAGVQADIETLAALKCHSCSIITALTDQNTRNIFHVYPQPADLIVRQLETIFSDIIIDVIKIGLISNDPVANAISEFLSMYPSIPIVFDPVLAAGGGYQTSNQRLKEALIDHIIPKTTIVTPNSLEARALTAQQDNLDLCADDLLASGCNYVLITGTHENQSTVINRLYDRKGTTKRFSWERLAADYHGSGCTLASSIAAYLAHGSDPITAIENAQRYTWNTLKHGYKVSEGQLIPNRLIGSSYM